MIEETEIQKTQIEEMKEGGWRFVFFDISSPFFSISDAYIDEFFQRIDWKKAPKQKPDWQKEGF